MDKTFHLSVHTILGTLCEEDVEYVNVPLTDGSIGILYGRAPLIGAVRAGDLKYRKDGTEHILEIGDGILQASDNKVTILLRNA